MDRPVDFLVVDEIQLAADRERGHVFTERLLHARGREETWFVGAETMRPLVRKLLPDAALLSRPRSQHPELHGAPSASSACPGAARSSSSRWPSSTRWPRRCAARWAEWPSCSAP